jgi:hypothetical protein
MVYISSFTPSPYSNFLLYINSKNIYIIIILKSRNNARGYQLVLFTKTVSLEKLKNPFSFYYRGEEKKVAPPQLLK